MPFDSMTISALAHELDQLLRGARVDKIHMPRRDAVVLSLRGQTGTHRLVLSCAGSGSVYLSSVREENPGEPPMLCMQLRKHLGGGRVLSVTQPEYERVVALTLSCVDELGEIGEKQLICELIGRKQNIVLVGSDGIILGCVRRIGLDMSEARQVLPGMIYRLPPRQDKRLLFDMTRDEIEAVCQSGGIAESVLKQIGGVSPVLAHEAESKGGAGQAAAFLYDLAQQTKAHTLKPYLLKKDGKAFDFCCAPAGLYESLPQQSFIAMLDGFYGEKTVAEGRALLTAGMLKTVRAAKKRVAKRCHNQRLELGQAQGREQFKKQADLITANLHQIRSGDARAAVADYFEPGMPQVVIELDTELSPQQNAQRLYKQYAKMKNAAAALGERIEKGEQELVYLESVEYALGQAGDKSAAEAIRDELTEAGYIKNQHKGKPKKKKSVFSFLEFEKDGFTILCGRNNRENEELTMRVADKRDLWLHAQKVPGSHVILRTGGRQVPKSVLEYAAGIAAQHSGAVASGRVLVDCTAVKNVKKPNGAALGMVNYFNYETYVIVL